MWFSYCMTHRRTSQFYKNVLIVKNSSFQPQPWRSPEKIGWFSNRTGTWDDDVKARGIVWILFLFDHIWVFVQRAPLWSEVPVLLLNQFNLYCSRDTRRKQERWRPRAELWMLWRWLSYFVFYWQQKGKTKKQTKTKQKRQQLEHGEHPPCLPRGSANRKVTR